MIQAPVTLHCGALARMWGTHMPSGAPDFSVITKCVTLLSQFVYTSKACSELPVCSCVEMLAGLHVNCSLKLCSINKHSNGLAWGDILICNFIKILPPSVLQVSLRTDSNVQPYMCS
jgi:hypothetical protein